MVPQFSNRVLPGFHPDRCFISHKHDACRVTEVDMLKQRVLDVYGSTGVMEASLVGNEEREFWQETFPDFSTLFLRLHLFKPYSTYLSSTPHQVTVSTKRVFEIPQPKHVFLVVTGMLSGG